jgi:hypothetical protein
MVNYQQGKIYKIIDNTNGNIYIGSTCKNTLAQRLSQHTSSYRKYTEKSIGCCLASYHIIKNEDYKIILIEDFSCENRDQLRAREQYWIDNTVCVNKNRALLTVEKISECKKQYYEDNKSYINERHRQYYEDNKEQLIQRQKQYNQTNRDHILEQKKKYQEDNKERIREYKRQYYQRKKLKLQEQEEAKSES